MEEIVVVRLEGLGTFAVPVEVLRAHRVVELDGAADGGSAGAVPLILREDFLHGVTGRRADLVVDRLGCVRHGGREPLFGRV